MAKPSFPWYPDDWLNDLGLRTCSPATRGIWMDLLCMMHQGDPYGHLSGKGGPLPVKIVAARCQVTTKELGRALAELEKHGVFDRTSDNVIFSRRMVRDERTRIARGNGGFKSLEHPDVPKPKAIHHGGDKGHHPIEAKDTFDPEEVKEEVKDLEEEKINDAWFRSEHDRWYLSAYWNHKGRKASEGAYKKAIYRLMKARPTSARAAADFLFQAAKDDRARFEPTQEWAWRINLYPATWLNNDRWEDEIAIISAPQKQSKEAKLNLIFGEESGNEEVLGS